jgi:hypothetical protein
MRYSPVSDEGTPSPGVSTPRLPILKSIKARNNDLYDFSEDKAFESVLTGILYQQYNRLLAILLLL